MFKTLLILSKFPKACLFDLYTCSFLHLDLEEIYNVQGTFQWQEKVSASRWRNIVLLHHIKLGKHPALREVWLAPWNRNEMFVIMLKWNTRKYTWYIRINSFCVNVWFFLFHKERIKGKKLFFSELLQLWEWALEIEGRKTEC